MIQSLERALDLLEYLADHPDDPVTATALADHFALNRSTATSLLKTLVARGYVEQAGPRLGYRLGPMTHYLVRHGPYSPDLVAAAEPVMNALATELQESFVLARLHQNRLFMLYQAQGDQVLSLRHDLIIAEAIYRTANGRLLLSYLGEPELRAFLLQKPLPDPEWPEARDERKLRQLLANISASGRYVDVTPQGVARASYPVRQHGKVVAALGLYAPAFRFTGRHRDHALKRLKEAVATIEQSLENRTRGHAPTQGVPDQC